MTYDPYTYGPPPVPQPPKKNPWKIAAIGCGGVLALILFAGCVAALSGSEDSADAKPSTKATQTQPSPDVTDDDEVWSDVTEDPEPEPTKAKEPTGYGDGDYEVGVDIEPGTYVSTGAQKGMFEFCMATTKHANGNVGELESSNADEQVILTVTSNDKIVSISGCEPFVLRK